ncbi:TIGR01459 family HAD-type hydrolase [Microvirga pudoricolor]|uniref:TIGR01459 family HAD-type hydrolase n=1 Tax=Microvirga pudoricolor TaxID=2778729 RepID=UPI0019507EAA|nr:TIGR01459 family HAD-type hydrolase [Microvirga pudoricolor]MBM6592730.1 TIGR01459 family HAD-type hydrolase [Microvirga pudoricolor]
MTDTDSIPLVDGIASFAGRYDLILCDVWGVLHNGVSAYEGAGDALSRFRQQGGTVVLVSNAPRPGTSVAAQLDGFGVPREAYDSVVTSGDMTRLAIEERPGLSLHHIGPPRDLPMFDGLGLRFAPLESADYVVCSGFDNDERETVEDYRNRLDLMRSRGLPVICANPDLVVERGDVIVPCAGTIALAYETMGGEVFYAGKPHRPVYERALAVASGIRGAPVAKDKVLAVGDAIRTDIAGADAFGIDSLMIARGIHTKDLNLHLGPLLSQHVQDWVALQAARPTAITDMLAWAA